MFLLNKSINSMIYNVTFENKINSLSMNLSSKRIAYIFSYETDLFTR